MSDGITDAYRAQRDHEDFETYLRMVVEYIKDPTDENMEKAIEQSGLRADKASVRKRQLIELREGDRDAWARQLHSARDTYPLKDLLEVSPYKGQILFALDFGDGRGLHIEDIMGFAESIHADGMCTVSDKYFVAVEPSALNIRWMWCQNCNIHVTTPFKKDRDKLWEEWKKKRKENPPPF